jgi:VanZ family protein
VVFTIVTLGSLLPQKQISKVDWTLSDKTLHFLMYMVFSASLYLFWIEIKRQMSTRRILILTAISSIGYGVLMEAMQYFFIKGRYGESLDALANTIGVLITVSIILTLNCFKLKFR